jgi:diamine N-acetyltransferase
MSVYFGTINPENWRIFNALKVKEEQKNFVASNVAILARAFAYRDDNSHIHAIYNGDEPIGILMQNDYMENDKLSCVLTEFMIAEQYQGKGYGKSALQLWLSMIKNENKYDSIILCYKEGDEIAYNLYRNMGFCHTGVVDEDEIIMEYNLKNNA